MKKVVVMLMMSLCQLPLRAQTDTVDTGDRYGVVGTHSFGVWDYEAEQMVVDSIYPYVEILEGPLFMVAYVDWNKAGERGTLPQPVTEFYDEEGGLVERNYNALLQEIRPPYTEVLRYARAFGLRDLEAAATFQEGIAYEIVGRRREAFRKYKQAYRLCPQLTMAKDYADAVMEKMKVQQDSVKEVLQWEAYERELRQAQAAASAAAVQASIAQLNYQNQQRKARQAQERTAASRPRSNSSTAATAASSSGRSSGTASTRARQTSKVKQSEGLKGRWMTCSGCSGKGTRRCWHCGGKGTICKSGIDKNGNQVFHDDRCGGCGGTGTARCSSCGGKGKNFVL